MEPPLLWHIPLSHFNEKVQWALDYKRIPHHRKVLGVDYLFRAWRATGEGKREVHPRLDAHHRRARRPSPRSAAWARRNT